MKEKEYVKRVREFLLEGLKGYSITSGEYLIYKVIINDGIYSPENPMNPKKNNYAFETDLLIKEGDTPLIVIEFKTDTLSTHDIITYSSKALMLSSMEKEMA
ncbi:MAG: hypothetical protein ACXAEX_08600 [Promethearchaeota archaeon]|jgi:hypothetical protein